MRWASWLTLAAAGAASGKKVDHDRTEPDVQGQTVEVQQITDDRSLLSPGYLFFAPSTWAAGWGPKIYDIDGLLLWDGRSASDGIAQQFHACNYGGKTGEHLCWHEASSLGALRKGQKEDRINDYNRVFDKSYRQVGQNYTTTGTLGGAPDSHEFHLVDNGKSYVQTVMVRRERDLSAWTGPKDGWVLDSCFMDVDLVTEESIYTWCYLDSLEIESHIYVRSPEQTNFTTSLGGDGSWFGAWDFFHINSIDKNDEGDYLISGRHNDQIIKLAGPDSINGKEGEILWKLGGDSNQFEYENDFIFTRQHDARYVHTEKDWTLFTIFDNAWEGEAPEEDASQPQSSGKLIGVNNKTMTARLFQEYKHPEGHLSRSGGSIQMLPNKNMFVGWGFIREVTEYAYDGIVLFHAHLKNKDGLEVNNYRNYKFPWVGQPYWHPKVVAYSQYCDRKKPSPLIAYVSWNGDTEVVRWNFKFSEYRHGPWMSATSVDKKEFETRAELAERFHPYVQVDGLDSSGNIIATSSIATFVPNKQARKHCDEDGCHDEDWLTYDVENSKADKCERGLSSTVMSGVFVFVVVCLELVGWFHSSILFGAGGEVPQHFQAYMMVEGKGGV